MGKRPRLISICPICDQPFDNCLDPDGTPHKLCCSTRCARISGGRKRRVLRIQHTCPICQVTFLDRPKKGRIYCSRKCFGVGKQRTPKRVTATCEYCGKIFTTLDPSGWSVPIVQRYCSHACSGKANAIARGQAVRKKLVRLCIHCGTRFTRLARPGRKYLYCSRRCFWAHHRGSNHTFWRGGTHRDYGPNWKEQRTATLERDAYHCRRCGSDDRPGVHHIVPRVEFGQDWTLMNELSNLVTLCPTCHANLHLHPTEEWSAETLPVSLLTSLSSV